MPPLPKGDTPRCNDGTHAHIERPFRAREPTTFAVRYRPDMSRLPEDCPEVQSQRGRTDVVGAVVMVMRPCPRRPKVGASAGDGMLPRLHHVHCPSSYARAGMSGVGAYGPARMRLPLRIGVVRILVSQRTKLGSTPCGAPSRAALYPLALHILWLRDRVGLGVVGSVGRKA